MAPEITIHTAGILVVEDDPAFFALLNILLQEAGARHIFLSDHPDKALHLLKAEKPDIVIIDITLDGRYEAGLELGAAIRHADHSVSIIILTALYTEEMYEKCRPLRPSAFLSKEISALKIKQAVELAIRHKLSAIAPPSTYPESKQGGLPYVQHRPVLLKTAEGYRQIPLEDILFFYADKKSTVAQTSSAAHILEVSLKALEEAFGYQFARIHKSYLVNLEAIESINPKESTLMINGISLPIGYFYRSVFFKRINITR